MAKALRDTTLRSLLGNHPVTIAMTTDSDTRDPNRQPTHPGAVLREDILPALALSVVEAAKALGVSRQMLHRLLAETAAMTPEMAVRVGKLCGNGPRVWLAMQQTRDLWQAERDLAEQLTHIPTMSAA